jgi:hypothetical protein
MNYPGISTPTREKVSLAFAVEQFLSARDSILRKQDIYDRARCEIEYYNRVFAEDCLNSLISVVKHQYDQPNNVKFIKHDTAMLGSVLPVTVFSATAISFSLGVYLFGSYYGWTSTEALSRLSLQEKVDLMIDRSAPYMAGMSTLLFLATGIIFSVVPAVTLSFLLTEVRGNRVSFGIYKNDHEQIQRLADKKSKRLIRACIGLASSLALSVAGAYAYDKLMGRF